MIYESDIVAILVGKMSKQQKKAIASKLEETIELTREEALALDLYLENQYIHYDNDTMHRVATKISKFCIQLFEDSPNETQSTPNATQDSGNQKNT